MGIRVNSNYFAGLLELRKQEEIFNLAPSASQVASLDEKISGNIESEGSLQPSLSFSADLGLSLLLGKASSTRSHPNFFEGDVLQTDTAALNQLELERSPDFQEFLRSTPGIGSRDAAYTNTPPQSITANFLTDSPEPPNTYENDIHIRPVQQNAEDARNAISRVASDYLSLNPSATRADLETAIDSQLGRGTADLFKVELVDQGNGISSVETSQLQVDQLSRKQQSILMLAALNATTNYSEHPVAISYSLDQPLVLQKMDQLAQAVGPEGAPLLADFATQISGPHADLLPAISHLREESSYLEISSTHRENLEDTLKEFENLDRSLKSSYQANALVDDSSTRFQSYRFFEAWSESQINESDAASKSKL